MMTLQEINDAIKAGQLSPRSPIGRSKIAPLPGPAADAVTLGRPWVWQMAAVTRDTTRRRGPFGR